MSTSVSGLSTNFFPSPQNGFTTSLASSISAGATSVPLNSVAGYANGDIAVLVIDPGNSSKQTFTGVVDTSGIQLTSVVWTAGTNVAHTAGAVVTDYATATHIAMVSKGVKIAHNADGTHKSGAVYTLPTISDFTNATHTHATTAQGGTLNTSVLNNPYKFAVHLSGTQTVSANTWTKVQLNTKDFDTGTNFDNATNYQFTAPIAGFYLLTGSIQGGSQGDTTVGAVGINVGSFSSVPTYQGSTQILGATGQPILTVTVLVQLSAAQTVQLYGYTGSTSFSVTASATSNYLHGFLVSAT